MAICGTTCNISIEGNTYEGHRYRIETSAEETDVRAFGDGEYGRWLACAKSGRITVDTYAKAAVAPGDVANVTCSIDNGNISLTASNCMCVDASADVDAKGVVEFHYTFRLTGDVANW